jgi:predicted pyridoxine 5'-phosphate oxidase superfamily flavin-nucleotide-binding protein
MLQYRVRPSHVLGASLIGATCCVASSGGEGARPIDDRTIAFGKIRSPGTIRNLGANPRIEVNFFDVFVRKGFRFAGTATVVECG